MGKGDAAFMNDEIRQFEFMSTAISDIADMSCCDTIYRRTKQFLSDFTFGTEHTSHTDGLLSLAQLVTSPAVATNRLRVTNMPDEMRDARLSIDDFTHDPVVVYAGKTTSPFSWGDSLLRADARAVKVADMCASYTGQTDGLVFPIAGIDLIRGFASVGLSMAPKDFSPRQIGMIHHAVTSSYVRLHTLLGPFPYQEQIHLTPKERAILVCLAAGATTAQTGQDLNMGHETVRTHIKTIKQKTGTTTIAHTIAHAIGAGLIHT